VALVEWPAADDDMLDGETRAATTQSEKQRPDNIEKHRTGEAVMGPHFPRVTTPPKTNLR